MKLSEGLKTTKINASKKGVNEKKIIFDTSDCVIVILRFLIILVNRIIDTLILKNNAIRNIIV